MTAIAAFWSFGAAEPAGACRRMLEAQSLYAPDDRPRIESDGAVAIGRRLNRRLPEDARDFGPASGARGALLAADVRLDNRDELASALSIAAERAAALPDAAILLAALERWDLDALSRLHGDFAFVLWQPEARRLVLARDFLGQRPLHYHRNAGFFAAASMPKGLHALPDVPREPDLEEASAFLALLPEDTRRSFFKDVEKVEPGHAVTVTPQGIESRRFWNPDLDPVRLRDDREYDEALRSLMDEAVRARLRGAGGAVASHLSAGLDSSTVSATAARLLQPSGGRVIALTAVPRRGFTGKGLRHVIPDEGPLAAEVAALYSNMEHVTVAGAARSPLRNLDRNFFLYDRPVLNLCNQEWSDEINELVKARGLSVLLIGLRGNMGFSYSGMTHLPRLLRRGRLIELARTSVALKRNGTRWRTLASQTLGPLLPAGAWRALQRMRGKATDVTGYTLVGRSKADGADLARLARDRNADFAFRPWSDGQAQRLWVLGGLDAGNYNKGVLGGWGLDMRDPTADRRLIEFCLRIPEGRFLAGGRARGLARRAFADRLPASVLNEPLKGYQAPDWYEGLAAARPELEFEAERLASVRQTRELLDTETLGNLLREWPAEGWDSELVLRRYRLALLRGVSTGHFVRKASGAN